MNMGYYIHYNKKRYEIQSGVKLYEKEDFKLVFGGNNDCRNGSAFDNYCLCGD